MLYVSSLSLLHDPFTNNATSDLAVCLHELFTTVLYVSSLSLLHDPFTNNATSDLAFCLHEPFATDKLCLRQQG